MVTNQPAIFSVKQEKGIHQEGNSRGVQKAGDAGESIHCGAAAL